MRVSHHRVQGRHCRRWPPAAGTAGSRDLLMLSHQGDPVRWHVGHLASSELCPEGSASHPSPTPTLDQQHQPLTAAAPHH